jgi:hydrogenase maturation protein HypF
VALPLVATSGNLSEEPICIDNDEARARLGGIADCFLEHDRPILRAVEDSVARIVRDRELLIRRARGYAPLPVPVGESGPSVLAVGAHLKNTVAVSKGPNVFLSQHIGDLETQTGFDAFTRACQDMQQLLAAPRELVVRDAHPDYLSSQHALRLDPDGPAVQHHYAHVLACMAENRLDHPVLGVVWDGAGLGDDGTLWGGEFLNATRDRCRRVGHLRTFRLPGGEAAAREPRRAAFGVLAELFKEESDALGNLPTLAAFEADEALLIAVAAAHQVNTPVTSSVGRLFDAVASLIGIRHRMTYEGQAAMELEHAAGRWTGPPRGYNMDLLIAGSPWILDWEPLIRAIIDDVHAEVPLEAIAHGLHLALAEGICAVASAVGIWDVVLTGGCFQNALLTEMATDPLETAGFRVHTHRFVPPNDGGVALGQALYGMRLAGKHTEVN